MLVLSFRKFNEGTFFSPNDAHWLKNIDIFSYREELFLLTTATRVTIPDFIQFVGNFIEYLFFFYRFGILIISA